MITRYDLQILISALVFVIIISQFYYVRKRKNDFSEQHLTREKIKVLWKALLVEILCIVAQAVTGHLLTGLGVAIVILMIYLNLNDPKSFTDSLTHLYNRHSFGTWMQQQIERKKERTMQQQIEWTKERKKERKKELYLFVVEFPNLRQINNTYGVPIGNALLSYTADYLRSCAPSGRGFRLGGRQLAIAVSSQSVYDRLVESVYHCFREPIEIQSEHLSVPAKLLGIGDCAGFPNVESVEAFIDYMSTAVPAANETVLVCSDEKRMEGFRYEQEVERYLHEAIEHDKFEICFQPVYSIREKRYVTAEALSRLSHPTLGPISPEVFIRIAERTGQISKIGELQFRRVCRFVSEHPEIRDTLGNIKFNLSPAELMIDGYGKRLVDVIREFGLSVQDFQFEITETVATEYSEDLYRIIRYFEQEGVNLCLDDFGSGYANLNTVLKMPFSEIKIDRSLLTGVCQNPQIALFYHSIVSVLHNLGYSVISEGVEEKRELDLLQSWGVDMIQGYYISRPVPGEQLLRQLKQLSQMPYEK